MDKQKIRKVLSLLLISAMVVSLTVSAVSARETRVSERLDIRDVDVRGGDAHSEASGGFYNSGEHVRVDDIERNSGLNTDSRAYGGDAEFDVRDIRI